ncbi:MAG: DUF4149 domain-containing protein [Leptolyngbyaceae cyanobacterium CRU_2_3]|nr:DUF4149 domain-containing protein [Leptolyngbyaceae cyanobacterium CRU_2_3]
MSALTTSKAQHFDWKTIVISVLAFWLSGSLLLDLVLMPTMYATGMMSESSFAVAGYSIFGVFNRIELLCAALVLTSILVLRNTRSIAPPSSQWAVPLAIGLLGIVLIFTYELAPEMSALGLTLNLFEPATPAPSVMNQMHMEYWVLELMKLVATSILLRFCYHQKSVAQS